MFRGSSSTVVTTIATGGGAEERLNAWLRRKKRRARVSPENGIILLLAGLSRLSTSISTLHRMDGLNENLTLGLRKEDPRFHISLGIQPKLTNFVLLSSILHRLLLGASGKTEQKTTTTSATTTMDPDVCRDGALCVLSILRCNLERLHTHPSERPSSGLDVDNKFVHGLHTFLLRLATDEDPTDVVFNFSSTNNTNTDTEQVQSTIKTVKTNSMSTPTKKNNRKNRTRVNNHSNSSLRSARTPMSAKAKATRAIHTSSFSKDIRKNAVESLVSGFHNPSPARRLELVQFFINDSNNNPATPNITLKSKEMQENKLDTDIFGLAKDQKDEMKTVFGSVLGPNRKILRERILEHVAHSKQVLSSLFPIDVPDVTWREKKSSNGGTNEGTNGNSNGSSYVPHLEYREDIDTNSKPPYTITQVKQWKKKKEEKSK